MSNVYIAPGAVVRGNVSIGESSSIWYNAVVRADGIDVKIGDNTNIQDNCVVHADPGDSVDIGNNVTVGHGAIIHGCRIGDNTLIGMGAIILNNAQIGSNCIVGAGALVTEGKIIPDRSLVIGSPAVIKREITEEEIEKIKLNSKHYCMEAKEVLESIQM